jgi:hypothetical protein
MIHEWTAYVPEGRFLPLVPKKTMDTADFTTPQNRQPADFEPLRFPIPGYTATATARALGAPVVARPMAELFVLIHCARY